MKINNKLKIGLLLILSFVIVGFMNSKMDNIIEPVNITPAVHKFQTVMTPKELKKQKNKILAKIPFVDKDFVGFKEALAYKESQGNYFRINTFGYLGKYQFGRNTLKELKVYKSAKEFLKNPELQEKVFLANLKKNKWILRKEIRKFSGKWINGVRITESGILAAAHLGGAGAVQKFLWSYGKKTMKDAYGTKIEHYLKKFSGYDLSKIKAVKEPKIIE